MKWIYNFLVLLLVIIFIESEWKKYSLKCKIYSVFRLYSFIFEVISDLIIYRLSRHFSFHHWILYNLHRVSQSRVWKHFIIEGQNPDFPFFCWWFVIEISLIMGHKNIKYFHLIKTKLRRRLLEIQIGWCEKNWFQLNFSSSADVTLMFQ